MIMEFANKFLLYLANKKVFKAEDRETVDYTDNFRALENWANKTGIPSIPGGAMTATVGTSTSGNVNPSAETKFFFQGGCPIFTPNAGGNATITFPIPFPNQVISVVATMAVALPARATFYIDSNTVTKTGFPIHITDEAAAAPYTTITAIHWIALGY